jgi:hypothetical protein
MIRVPLTRGLFAVIDDADADLVAGRRWQALTIKGETYARCSIRVDEPSRRQRIVYMQSLISGFPRTNHVDGDRLNNQRSNLRPATREQSGGNRRVVRSETSPFKGVTVNRSRGLRWKAYIRDDHLGYFQDAADAARAYDLAAREVYGEFAALNFPEPGERSALRNPTGAP